MTRKEPSSKVPLEKSSRGGKQIGKLCKDYEPVNLLKDWTEVIINENENN